MHFGVVKTAGTGAMTFRDQFSGANGSGLGVCCFSKCVGAKFKRFVVVQAGGTNIVLTMYS